MNCNFIRPDSKFYSTNLKNVAGPDEVRLIFDFSYILPGTAASNQPNLRINVVNEIRIN